MRKIAITFVLTTLLSGVVYSQVTIGTLNPPQTFSILELISDPAAYVGGLRLPQLTEADKTSLASQLTGATALSKGLFIYNKDNNCIEYWNGTEWVVPGEGGPWMKAGTTDFATLNTDSIYQMGSVAIGHSGAADPSAILNVEATNQGVLFPRVTLSGAHDNITIPNPTTGLMVYNTGDNPSFTTKGYLYWGGSDWKLFTSSTSVAPSIATLNCMGATLSPSAYTTNVPYTGVMKMPYQGGNSGYYVGGDNFTANGLTFTLQDGKLENGMGELVFSVEGTPNISSPTAVTIPINGNTLPNLAVYFWNGDCQVKVGDQVYAEIKSVAVMGNFIYTTEGRAGYHITATTPDGRFSVRAFIYNNQPFANVNLQIRNNTGSTLEVASNEATFYAGGAVANSRNTMPVPSGKWGGNGNNTGANGNTWVDQTATNFASWGNEAVYYSNYPEHRIYAFTVADGNDEVFYLVDFMMMTTTTGGNANTTTCPNGECHTTKAFFKIDQIRAI